MTAGPQQVYDVGKHQVEIASIDKQTQWNAPVKHEEQADRKEHVDLVANRHARIVVHNEHIFLVDDRVLFLIGFLIDCQTV